MASGGVGGMSFWISVFPADVIKSRVQVLKQENFRQMGFFNMMMDIIRNEGNSHVNFHGDSIEYYKLTDSNFFLTNA